jgi:hypothetical protein
MSYRQHLVMILHACHEALKHEQTLADHQKYFELRMCPINVLIPPLISVGNLDPSLPRSTIAYFS